MPYSFTRNKQKCYKETKFPWNINVPCRACLQITQHYVYALKLPSEINLFSSKIFPLLNLSQTSCPLLCFPPLKFQNLVPPFFVVPPIDLYYSSFPCPKFSTYVYITGLHKLASNILSTCVIRCNTDKQK